MSKVIVEIFMTDQWASGPYMVQSVKVLPTEIQEVIEVHLWDVKTLDGIKRKKALGARAVPSIAINEEVVFQSGIPQHEELIDAIRERLSGADSREWLPSESTFVKWTGKTCEAPGRESWKVEIWGIAMPTRKFRRAALLKAVILLMFIVAAVLTVRLTGIKELRCGGGGVGREPIWLMVGNEGEVVKGLAHQDVSICSEYG
jgi:hypothetical protein